MRSSQSSTSEAPRSPHESSQDAWKLFWHRTEQSQQSVMCRGLVGILCGTVNFRCGDVAAVTKSNKKPLLLHQKYSERKCYGCQRHLLIWKVFPSWRFGCALRNFELSSPLLSGVICQGKNFFLPPPAIRPSLLTIIKFDLSFSFSLSF